MKIRSSSLSELKSIHIRAFYPQSIVLEWLKNFSEITKNACLYLFVYRSWFKFSVWRNSWGRNGAIETHFGLAAIFVCHSG